MEYTKSSGYAATVSSLPEAFAFIMWAQDQGTVGDSPQIEISPIWRYDDSSSGGCRKFEVSVKGSVEITEESLPEFLPPYS